MAAYVDQMRLPFRGYIMSHLTADSLAELHAMARRIGMQRRWFQAPPIASYPHYDIPEDKRDTIFNRFEANAHSGGSRGAGLGLAIARSLIELHGGTISLDATVEKGASFVCRLPKEPEIQVQAAE